MIRPTQDNVIVVLDPLKTERKTDGGIIVVENMKPAGARASRWGTVVAAGPGHYRQARCRLGDRAYTEETGVFIKTEVAPNDRVLIDADAGQDYQLDFSIPRHNLNAEFQELCGEKGEFRVVRESEIHLYERPEPEATAAE